MLDNRILKQLLYGQLVDGQRSQDGQKKEALLHGQPQSNTKVFAASLRMIGKSCG